MTKITFKPWVEIIVHETIKRKLEDLVKLKTLYFKSGQVAEIFLWAEGIIFVRVPMPQSDEVISDQLKGIIHYSSVEYASMPRYRSTIVSKGITIPIVDVSDTPALRDLAKELKKEL
jgi:hypothetical protein